MAAMISAVDDGVGEIERSLVGKVYLTTQLSTFRATMVLHVNLATGWMVARILLWR